MNETADATLVIQIFEFIRGDLRPSSTPSCFSFAFLPPLILLRSSSLSPTPAILLSRIPLSCWLENTRESLSLLASTVFSPVSAFTYVSLLFPLSLFLFFCSSPRFRNNNYALLRLASNAGIFCPRTTVDDIVSFMIRIFGRERSTNNNVEIIEISSNPATNNRQFFFYILSRILFTLFQRFSTILVVISIIL